MGANCSTDPNVGCIYHLGDGKCSHPRKKAGRRLPTYEAGRINCLWGVSRRLLDPTDMTRALIDNPYKPQPPHNLQDDADAVQSGIEQEES